MDDPDCDPERLRATLRRFDTVNRLVSGWGGVYARRIRPFLSGLGRPARVLDLGCGGGDVLVRLARLAARDGMPAEWVGADPDPRAIEVAAARGAPGTVRFTRADSTALLAAGERFDLVVSNHVLHHLDTRALASFTSDSRELATGLVLHGDIARSRLAYGLYAIGIIPLQHGTFLRTDGLRSIRRSHTPAELQRILDAESPRTWRVGAPAPFRLLAESRPGSGTAHRPEGASDA